MKLTDFEYYFFKKILERGEDLLNNNAVTPVRTGSKKHCFTVNGTKLYSVSIDVGKYNVITDAKCDCPYYEQGNLCKHIAACLYFLRKRNGVNFKPTLSVFFSINPDLAKSKDYIIVIKNFLQFIVKQIKEKEFTGYTKELDFELGFCEILQYLQTNLSNASSIEISNTYLFLYENVLRINSEIMGNENNKFSTAALTAWYNILSFKDSIAFKKIYKTFIKKLKYYRKDSINFLKILSKLADTDEERQEIITFINILYASKSDVSNRQELTDIELNIINNIIH